MTDTTVAPKEFGVRLFRKPPEDFDALVADQRELLAYGFPARPDPRTEPKLSAQWRRRASRRYTRIDPVFVRNTDKVHGPLRGPAAQEPTGFRARVADATSTNWSGSAVFAAP